MYLYNARAKPCFNILGLYIVVAALKSIDHNVAMTFILNNNNNNNNLVVIEACVPNVIRCILLCSLTCCIMLNKN